MKHAFLDPKNEIISTLSQFHFPDVKFSPVYVMTECQHVIIIPLSCLSLPPSYLVADIKAPKMLNRVLASIFAVWSENWGNELK